VRRDILASEVSESEISESDSTSNLAITLGLCTPLDTGC
jgi:hypothetical protein